LFFVGDGIRTWHPTSTLASAELAHILATLEETNWVSIRRIRFAPELREGDRLGPPPPFIEIGDSRGGETRN
jgi:hypothetical protein